MDRNTMSRWSTAHSGVTQKRSRFDRSMSHKTTFNVGQIIPFYLTEILPGDSVSIDTAKVVRLQPMVTPPFDDLYLDTMYFFVPNRLIWNEWKQFQGENPGAWIPEVEYTVPQMKYPTSIPGSEEVGWAPGSIGDYLGIPPYAYPWDQSSGGLDSVNALPFRAFAQIYNDWFRDENLEPEVYIEKGTSTVTGSNGSTILTDLAKGGMPPLAHKFRDYFTACLPAPLKHADVTLPSIDYGLNPVYATEDIHPPYYEGMNTSGKYTGDWYPLAFANYNNNENKYENSRFFFTEATYVGQQSGSNIGVESGYLADSHESGEIPKFPDDGSAYQAAKFAVPVNLWANVSGAQNVSINQLRLAFAIQKAYEVDARCGSRYTEAIKARFGVTSPDFRLQRSEYLGGNRIKIQVNQVLQTSSTDEVSPQGNPTGISVTHDNNSDFTKSFTEHGYLIGVCVARYNHTYQQGLERLWKRKTRFDFYEPMFANIGEQPVLNSEIYLSSDSSLNEQVFGYNEAWADYRYQPSRVSGEMRSSHPTSLDSWHFADEYSETPTLSAAWSREDKTNVDRVLSIQSSVSNQLFADFYIRNYHTRVMPVYSVPGLIDHA